MHKFGKVIFGLNMTSQYDSICIMIYNSIYIETFSFHLQFSLTFHIINSILSKCPVVKKIR